MKELIAFCDLEDDFFADSIVGVEGLLNFPCLKGDIDFLTDDLLELSKRPVLILDLIFLNLFFSLKIFLFKKTSSTLAEISRLVLSLTILIISSS